MLSDCQKTQLRMSAEACSESKVAIKALYMLPSGRDAEEACRYLDGLRAGAVWNKTAESFTWPTGTILYVRFPAGDDEYRYGGLELSLLVIDEDATLSDRARDFLSSLVRSPHEGMASRKKR